MSDPMWLNGIMGTPTSERPRFVELRVPEFKGAQMAMPPERAPVPAPQPAYLAIGKPNRPPGHEATCGCRLCVEGAVQVVECSDHGRVGVAVGTPPYALRLAERHLRESHDGRGFVQEVA